MTYNILSEMTVTPAWFPQTDKKFLEPKHRMNLLKQYLQPYVDKHYILCLQEVSTKDWKHLKTYFEKVGYLFVHQTISNGNSRLGLSICVPNQYKIINQYIVRVGQVIKESIGNVIFDPDITEASGDKRQVVMVELQIGSKNLFVATYHMPCRFLQQTLMEAHTLFAMKIINDVVGNSPVIFTGDFNSKYNEAVYKILTSNDYQNEFALNVVSMFDSCKNFFKDSLTGVEERLPTCYDQKDGNSYILDYIFYRNLQLISSELINHAFPIPNELYSSDHLPIIGTFSL